MLWFDHISSEYALSSTLVIVVNMHYHLLYQYTAHYLLLYLGLIMLFSYAIVDLYLFCDGAVDMQI